MLCCSTSVLQTSQPATNQTYRSLHCCWRIYVMTPCIQWKDFLPRLLLVSVSGGTVYAQSGQENWKTVLCAMWNWHRNRVVCHLCHNFDNLSLLCPAIGAKRVGFSFHFFGWGHEGGGSRFFCPFCKRWQQYIVTKMTPSCFMYTLSFLLFEEDRCYSDGSVITNFSFYSSRFREQSSLSIFTPSPKLSL